MESRSLAKKQRVVFTLPDLGRGREKFIWKCVKTLFAFRQYSSVRSFVCSAKLIDHNFNKIRNGTVYVAYHSIMLAYGDATPSAGGLSSGQPGCPQRNDEQLKSVQCRRPIVVGMPRNSSVWHNQDWAQTNERPSKSSHIHCHGPKMIQRWRSICEICFYEKFIRQQISLPIIKQHSHCNDKNQHDVCMGVNGIQKLSLLRIINYEL